MKKGNLQENQQVNIDFDSVAIKRKFDELSDSVDRKMREADAKNSRSMAAAARFIANV